MTLALVRPGDQLPSSEPLLRQTSIFDLYEEAREQALGLLGAPALEFRVEGTPGPQGSKKAVGVDKAGRALLVESSKKVKPWRAAVTGAALATFPPGWQPLRGPVVLSTTFVLARPQRIPPERRGMPASYPDCSKLVRSTEDGMTEVKKQTRTALLFAGVWKDDGQVCDLFASKRYVGGLGDPLGHTGALIRVWPLP